VYAPKKDPMHNSTRRPPTRANKGNKRPGTEYTGKVPKKAHTKKHCNLCNKFGGTNTIHNTKDCCRYEKVGMEKSNIHTAKKGREKPNSTKHVFMQLRKKMDRLEKGIKELDAKQKKRCHSNGDSKLE
jgi:hypothetical protein